MIGVDSETIQRTGFNTNIEVYSSHSPKDFTEALMEFSSYCDRQLPKIFQTVFAPLCFAFTSKEDCIVLGGVHGNIANLEIQTEKILRDEEICYEIPICNLVLALQDTQIVLCNAEFELFFLEYPSFDILHKITMSSSPILLAINNRKTHIYLTNGENKVQTLGLSNELDYYSVTYFQFDEIPVENTISCISMSDENEIMALGYDTGVISIIEIATTRFLNSPAYTSPPSLLIFSDSDLYIASAYEDFTIKVWAIASSLTVKFEISKHTDTITGLAFVRGNNYLVSSSLDTNINIWDMHVESLPYSMNMSDSKILRLLGSKDHRTVYYIQENNSVMSWNIPRLPKNARYRGYSGKIIQILFVPNTFELLSISEEGIAILWDYHNHIELERKSFETALTGAILSKKANFVLVSSTFACLYYWDLTSGSTSTIELQSPAISCSFSKDECILAISDHLNRVLIYDFLTMERRVTIKGRSLLIRKFIFISEDQYLITACDDHTMGKWDNREERWVCSVPGHSSPVVSLLATDHGLFISAAHDGHITVWNLDCLALYTLSAVDPGAMTGLYLSKDHSYLIGLQWNRVSYWELQSLALIFQTDTVFQGNCIAVTEDENFVAVAEGDTVYFEESPLKSSFIRIVGKSTGSPQRFMKFIMDCQKESPKVSYDNSHNHWVIAPYLIGAAHVLSYFNRFSELNTAFFEAPNRASFFATANNEYPLTLSVNMEYKICIDICLKYMKLQSQSKNGNGRNLRAYLPLASCLDRLNAIDYPYIVKLYDSLFIEASDEYLPRFALHEAELPLLRISDHMLIYPSEMMAGPTFTSTGRPICFTRSAIPLDIDLGTFDSISFMQSLVTCSDPKIFRTSIVQEYLQFKWSKIKPLIYIVGLTYVLYLVLLGLHIVIFLDSRPFLALLIFVHLLLLAFEVLQIATDFTEYWFRAWNVLDQLRSISFSYYAIMAWQGDYNTDILLATLIFSWARGIACFRMFDETRYMVRLIIQVIVDITTFFFILFYATLAFAFVFYMRNPTAKSFPMYLTMAYRLDLGDFDTHIDNPFDWVIFFVSTMINPLIMLNLLIAIMSDTASFVAEIDDIYGLKELAEMIIDAEKMLFWKKLYRDKHYLHKCNFVQDDDLSMNKTEKRIKVIKRQAKEIEKTIRTIKKNATVLRDRLTECNINNLLEEGNMVKAEMRYGFELSGSLIRSIQQRLA